MSLKFYCKGVALAGWRRGRPCRNARIDGSKFCAKCQKQDPAHLVAVAAEDDAQVAARSAKSRRLELIEAAARKRLRPYEPKFGHSNVCVKVWR